MIGEDKRKEDRLQRRDARFGCKPGITMQSSDRDKREKEKVAERCLKDNDRAKPEKKKHS